jgi:hypothetical protein
MDTKRYKTLLSAILVLSFCTFAFADSVIVLRHRVQPVSSGSSGRYVKIVWSAVVKNTTPTPLTCKVTLSFYNGEDKVISRAVETQELEPLREKTVKGTVRLRTSVAQQIATTNVSVVAERP